MNAFALNISPLAYWRRDVYLGDMVGSHTTADTAAFAITERAAAQIASILAQEGAGACLRVAVQGGGCSGFSYTFSIDDTRTDDDHTFAQSGITVLVDDISLQYMHGAEIDWVDDLIGSAFRINNPNATASCGCGTSFDIS